MFHFLLAFFFSSLAFLKRLASIQWWCVCVSAGSILFNYLFGKRLISGRRRWWWQHIQYITSERTKKKNSEKRHKNIIISIRIEVELCVCVDQPSVQRPIPQNFIHLLCMDKFSNLFDGFIVHFNAEQITILFRDFLSLIVRSVALCVSFRAFFSRLLLARHIPIRFCPIEHIELIKNTLAVNAFFPSSLSLSLCLSVAISHSIHLIHYGVTCAQRWNRRTMYLMCEKCREPNAV